MNNLSFGDKVAKLLEDDGSANIAQDFEEVLKKLREFAGAIEKSLGQGAEVLLESGHRVNMGQQYNVVIRIPRLGLRDVLFRAYVPFDGLPVRLDLFEDERPTCPSIADLEETLIQFLREPDVKQRLLEMKREAQIASKHTA